MRKLSMSLPMALLRARESAVSYFRQLLNESGLTEQQWRVIRILHEFGELEFRELSKICCIQPPSLTGILTRLERDEMVQRNRSVADQRRLHISLTRSGIAKFSQLSDRAEFGYRTIEKRLGRERYLLLMDILRDLADIGNNAESKTSARKDTLPTPAGGKGKQRVKRKRATY